MANFSKVLKGVKDGFGAIPVVGSAISSVLGIVDGLFGKSDEEKYKDKLNADKAYQKEMIDYTNEANLLASQKSQAYNWQNYDSPAAKMQAYKDAGINPNQVAGQGYQLSGVTASASAPSAQGYQDSRMAKLNAGIQLGALSSQLQGMKYDNLLKKESLLYQKEMRKKLEDENLNMEEEYLQYYQDESFNDLMQDVTSIAKGDITGGLQGMNIPELTVTGHTTREQKIAIGRKRKHAIQYAMKTLDNSKFMAQAKNEIDLIANDAASIKKLKESGLLPLFQEMQHICNDADASLTSLKMLKAQYNKYIVDVNRDKQQNWIFDTDWKFEPKFKPLEYILKSILQSILSAVGDRVSSYFNHNPKQTSRKR